MNLRSFLNHLSFSFVLLLIFSILFFWFTYFYPFQPVKWADKQFPVITHTVKAGEYLTFKMNFEKKMDISPTVTWYLVDGTVVKLAETGVTRPLGVNSFERNIFIPVSTYPGEYFIQVEVVYEIFPWRKLTYVLKTEKFKVFRQ